MSTCEIITQGLEYSQWGTTICMCSFLSTSPAPTHLTSVHNMNTFNVKCFSQLLLAKGFLVGEDNQEILEHATSDLLDRASGRFWKAKERVLWGSNVMHKEDYSDPCPHLLHLYHLAPVPRTLSSGLDDEGCSSLICWSKLALAVMLSTSWPFPTLFLWEKAFPKTNHRILEYHFSAGCRQLGWWGSNKGLLTMDCLPSRSTFSWPLNQF